MRSLYLTILLGVSLWAKSQGTFGLSFHGDSLFLKRSATDSQCINYRQPILSSAVNIKTVNGSSLLGSGDIAISGSAAWGSVTGTLANQTDLQTALNGKQATITQGTTAQYFRGDLSLATFPTTTAAFSNSTNKNFVTDAQATVIGNTSGTNTGDNAVNSLYSGLVSNASHTGDATGSTALTLATVNGNVGSFGSATQVPNYTVNAKGLITAAANTTIQIAESQVTNLTTDLGLKANLASPTFTGTVVLPNSAVTNVMLAGSIDLTTKVTGVLPYANGGVGSTAATSATTGTMTVNMTTEMITITPTGACTFNGSGGIQGQRITFLVTTSGVSSFTLTWGTNYRTTSTLATGTTSARLFAVTFICTNGTQWIEIARTAAMP